VIPGLDVIAKARSTEAYDHRQSVDSQKKIRDCFARNDMPARDLIDFPNGESFNLGS
jgi:hypothetical protein